MRSCWICTVMRRKSNPVEFYCTSCKRYVCKEHMVDFGPKVKICLGCNSEFMQQAAVGATMNRIYSLEYKLNDLAEIIEGNKSIEQNNDEQIENGDLKNYD